MEFVPAEAIRWLPSTCPVFFLTRRVVPGTYLFERDVIAPILSLQAIIPFRQLPIHLSISAPRHSWYGTTKRVHQNASVQPVPLLYCTIDLLFHNRGFADRLQ